MEKPINKITSLTNPLVKNLVRIRREKDFRELHKSVLITSKKTILELSRTQKPKLIIISDTSLLDKDREDITYCASQEILKKITGLENHEGIASVFTLPEPAEKKQKFSPIIVFDRIQDPSNMGSLIRSAKGLGAEALIVIEGSCDLFNEKVNRASKAYNMQIPYFFFSDEEALDYIVNNQLELIVADLKGKDLFLFERKKKICHCFWK